MERQRDPLRLGGVDRARVVGRELPELLAEDAVGAFERLLRREAVDEAVELVVVANRLLVERGDERPAVRLDRDPALLFERDQRLANRDAADPERLGDVVLVHPRARSQVAVEDQLADVERRGATAAPAVQLTFGKRRLGHGAVILRFESVNAFGDG